MDLPELLIDGPHDAPVTIALAHGAGAPMDTAFMTTFAQGLAARGLRCVRFEFPYMAGRRVDDKKRPPNRAPILLDTWRAVIDHLGRENLVISGKSMGGRMASMVASELETEGHPVKGVICLGYPFHPPGKPEKAEGRMAHLRTLKTPTLILQGTRDTFGTIDQVPSFPLSKTIRVQWLEDGDHGFKPRKKSGRSEAQNWAEAIEAMDVFVRAL
ncbi:alpha/beta fold hydrolase [Magnetovibrio blakemorei]|uniref:Alpha/beta hydrolase n=1 Tax=Magnetovibrio blakemorei TaxID=28181 RepID=A0A1E5Q8W7_9PROT|nr:alpha/beta fold hydrolase [Magnetovibrio blakemorei]OEJ67829.1 alpha/beta hydrolase [Magnetovibrio blakemorei]